MLGIGDVDVCADSGTNRLMKEEKGGNWLYAVDQLAPLEIYD